MIENTDNLRDIAADRAGGRPGDANYDPELLNVLWAAAEEIDRLRNKVNELQSRLTEYSLPF